MIEVRAGQKVLFDVSGQDQHAVPTLIYMRPGGCLSDLYVPAHQRIVDGCLEWHVSDYDAAISGEGHAQIVTTGAGDDVDFGEVMTIWVNE